MKKLIFLLLVVYTATKGYSDNTTQDDTVIWKIGEADNSSNEFALAPANYKDFLKGDYGWEDRSFLIGTSTLLEDWPYAMPGPDDRWGGTSGRRMEIK